MPERGGTRRLDLHRHHLPVVTLKNKVNLVVLPVAVMRQIAALRGGAELTDDFVDGERFEKRPSCGGCGRHKH